MNDFKSAKSGEEQYEVLKEYDKLISKFSTMGSVSHVRYTINTKDEFYSKEKDFYDEVSPLIQEKTIEFTKVLVASEFKDFLVSKIGEVAFLNAELELKSFSPEIVELMQEENALTSEYQALYASATAEFDGKTLPLPMLTPYKESTDREVRKAAFVAEGKFFDDNQEKFDELFDKLVKNRTAQAHKMGYKNFVELGYIRRTRNCYSPADVENFRSQVIAEIVPVVAEIRENQAKRIGLENLTFYDMPLSFKDGSPTPQGTSDEILAAGRKMYEEMMPETKEFVTALYDNELFDVLSKDGKAPGGYCTSFSEYNVPFIFSNFNGTSGDVDVLTHEAGHAFNAYRNLNNNELKNFGTASLESMEIAETHSMAMEFLTTPWHELFFKEQTAKYKLAHAEDSLIFIPYGCSVDHFQEMVYANPDMTAEERNEAWKKLDNMYRPGIDYDNLPFYGRYAGWQRQLHIYLYPFYYIDYCMAQTMALQFFAEFLKDKDLAYKKYLEFVDLGGFYTFVDSIKTTGFKSPLENGSIKSIVDTLKDWLSENQV
ncbi:MAG: M3 family oligoendopeptidase [Clostridia bacterium]